LERPGQVKRWAWVFIISWERVLYLLAGDWGVSGVSWKKREERRKREEGGDVHERVLGVQELFELEMRLPPLVLSYRSHIIIRNRLSDPHISRNRF
jgi:hypothetical protein